MVQFPDAELDSALIQQTALISGASTPVDGGLNEATVLQNITDRGLDGEVLR